MPFTASRPNRGRPGRRALVQPRKKPTTGGKDILGKGFTPRAQQPNAGKPGLGAAPNAPRPAPPGQHAAPDAAYNNAVDTSRRQEQSSLEGLDASEQATRHEFGIDDPTNPFSRAEGLKRSFLAKQKAASTGLAGQGKLYSGTHERAMSRTRREEEAARAELRGAYEGALRSIGEARAGVSFSSEEDRNQAFEDWLARAPDAEVDLDPTAQAAADTGTSENSVNATGHDVSLEDTTSRPQAGRITAAPGEPVSIQKLGKKLAKKKGKKQRIPAPPAGEPRGNQHPKAPPKLLPKPKPKARRK